MDSFYVYYRVDVLQLDAARVAVENILDQIQISTGIRGRLMQRADDAGTWMEIFEDVGDPVSFRRALDEIVAQSRLLTALADNGKRHIEHFRSVDHA